MKNVILAFIGIFITLYTVTIGFSIFSLETRKNELENQVSRIVENTLEQEYEAEDEEAVHYP